MEKAPPPSYVETFSGNADSSEVEGVLKSVTNVAIAGVPVLTQLLSSPESSAPPTKAKAYTVADQGNGVEIFQVFDISAARGDPNIRGLTLALPQPTEKSVLHLGYRYSPAFVTLEMSSPDGAPIGTFQRDGLGAGLLGMLCCPCLCLWFCCPIATASIKNSTTGVPILVGDAYLLPRKINISRPGGGVKIGCVSIGGLMAGVSVSVQFEEAATPNEKLLVCGLGVGMMDFEILATARGAYQRTGHHHHHR